MKIYPTRPMLIDGNPVEVGEPVDVSDQDGNYLIATGSATAEAPGKKAKAADKPAD